MLRHLDGWARRQVTSPESWGSALEVCGQWADYSPRNQVLLASYGVVGAVAGSATWELVPSTEAGRMCAVRAGEHGLPVRVPVVGPADAPSDRTRLGARSSSAVAALRWEHVFAVEQLARRPRPAALAVVGVPVMGEREWREAVRLAAGRVTGRTPRNVGDPIGHLAVLAGRIPLGSGRLRLGEDLCRQAAWVAASRAGVESEPMAAFDPASLSARERWRTLVDVRHAAGQLLVGLSHALEVDLCASPLPRHGLADDRVVAPGRRNCLAPADVRGLPLGVWIEVGPYCRGEWAARGIDGAAGVGAFCRVNDRSYLAAYETRGGAIWRLETAGRGSHRGLVAEGTAETLAAAKDSASSALSDRYPEAANSVAAEVSTVVFGPHLGWVDLAGGADGRTKHRVFDDRVTATISLGIGGWQTRASLDGKARQGPVAPTAEEARVVAEGLARGVLMEVAALAPDRANRLVADLAVGDAWKRATLVDVVGHRLTNDDRQDLRATTDPARLVELLGDTGVLTPVTIVAVLRAEGVDAETVAGLIPAIGMTVPDAIRVLHRDWDVDRLDAAQWLDATVDELRAAGCTSAELLAASPREALRRLDTREHTWELVAPTLLEAGYGLADAIDHLTAHAPTPATFSAGVATLVDDPTEAFSLAARRAGPEDLAALSERYGLAPLDTALALAAAGVPAPLASDVIHLRCEHDPDTATAILAEALGVQPDDGQLDIAQVIPLRPHTVRVDEATPAVGIEL